MFIALDHHIHSIDDYDILCALDRSDYSIVYKAYHYSYYSLDKKTGLIVAIKVINLVNQTELTQAV
jgi:serine/threonine-protein kinase 24/25/MST4